MKSETQKIAVTIEKNDALSVINALRKGTYIFNSLLN